MIEGTLAALAGLGFFLAGLHLLSEAVRTLAVRRLRLTLAGFSRSGLANVIAGSMLGAITQSTSASAFVCIGLLSARAISFPAALTISAWASVGTSVLVFLASVDLHALALLAVATVGLLYLASLHRSEAGRRTTDLLLAIGVTLFGLTMLKATGQALGDNAWIREFFAFAAESWIYSFIIGFMVTLVMQSSSTVSALAVMLCGAGLMPLDSAIVLVCGANAGSGMSVAMVSAHLTGPPRQVALWQAVVKFIGALAVLPLALLMPENGPAAARLTALMPVPMLLSIAFLLINLLGAMISGLLRAPLLKLLDLLAPIEAEHHHFAPSFILAEAAEDPETAFLLARKEQAKLVSLLPGALAAIRAEEPGEEARLGNAEREALAMSLAGEIADFVSTAVNNHPSGTDVSGLLLLQRCNGHVESLVEALHAYVAAIASLTGMAEHEAVMCHSMTEALHLLLGFVAEQGAGDAASGETLRRLTGDRADVMSEFRQQIVGRDTESNANREALFTATGLFERIVWLVRQISTDFGDIARSGGELPAAAA